MSVFSNKKTLPKSILSSPIKATTAKTTTATLTESSWNKSPTNRGVRKTTTFLSAESKKPNKWNIFRSKHAGEGLTMAQLSARYHKQNDSDSNSEDSEDDEEEDSEDDEEEDGEDDSGDEDYDPDNHDKKKRKKRNEKIAGHATLAALGIYAISQLVKWTKGIIADTADWVGKSLIIFAALFASLKAYDNYFLRFKSYRTLSKLDDEKLNEKINELSSQLCWWGNEKIVGFNFRPQCPLIKAEYEKAIKIRNNRKEKAKEDKKIRNKATGAYNDLKNKIPKSQVPSIVSERIRDELLDDINFCKLMIQTAEQESEYKPTTDDFIKLSGKFNMYQKWWEIKVPITQAESYLREKEMLLIANDGKSVNCMFHNYRYATLQEKSKILGMAFIYCAELHVNKVTTWIAIDAELRNEIQTLDERHSKLKGNFKVKWMDEPIGRAKKIGIYSELQVLKPKPEMSYDDMMKIPLSTIEQSLEYLNETYISKLPDEMKTTFENIKINSDYFQCYRTFGMMASFKLIKAANESAEAMKEIRNEIDNNKADVTKIIRKQKQIMEFYSLCTGAHIILRSDNLSEDFIMQICDESERAFNNPLKLAKFITEIYEKDKPKQEKKTHSKQLSVNKQLSVIEDKPGKYMPTGETKEDSEVLSSEEKEKEKDGPAVGDIINGFKSMGDYKGKVVQGEVTRIHTHPKNQGKVTIKFQNEKGETVELKYVTPNHLVKKRVKKRLGDKRVKTRKVKKYSAKKGSNRVDNILTI